MRIYSLQEMPCCERTIKKREPVETREAPLHAAEWRSRRTSETQTKAGERYAVMRVLSSAIFFALASPRGLNSRNPCPAWPIVPRACSRSMTRSGLVAPGQAVATACPSGSATRAISASNRSAASAYVAIGAARMRVRDPADQACCSASAVNSLGSRLFVEQVAGSQQHVAAGLLRMVGQQDVGEAGQRVAHAARDVAIDRRRTVLDGAAGARMTLAVGHRLRPEALGASGDAGRRFRAEVVARGELRRQCTELLRNPGLEHDFAARSLAAHGDGARWQARTNALFEFGGGFLRNASADALRVQVCEQVEQLLAVQCGELFVRPHELRGWLVDRLGWSELPLAHGGSRSLGEAAWWLPDPRVSPQSEVDAFGRPGAYSASTIRRSASRSVASLLAKQNRTTRRSTGAR